MSFHWEYEGKGENAAVCNTWGDGGVMEYFIRYGKGYTHIRNGENAETEYYYGEDKLIYKIVDANRGNYPPPVTTAFKSWRSRSTPKATPIRLPTTNSASRSG